MTAMMSPTQSSPPSKRRRILKRVRSEKARNIRLTWVSALLIIFAQAIIVKERLRSKENLMAKKEETSRTRMPLLQRSVAEGVGTGFLLIAVVGSGIMAERLSAGNVGLALLENSIATGAALIALILTFGQVSGAHFNPAVTLADASLGGIAWRDVPSYIAAQIVGAFVGVGAANLMFNEPVFFVSHRVRMGFGQVLGEFIATFGLLAVIWGCARLRSSAVPFAVGAYIAGAYWFTSSTSFANPAVTLARTASDTFAGIRPLDVPAFLVAQLLGAAAGTLLFWWLIPSLPNVANKVLARNEEVVISSGEEAR